MTVIEKKIWLKEKNTRDRVCNYHKLYYLVDNIHPGREVTLHILDEKQTPVFEPPPFRHATTTTTYHFCHCPACALDAFLFLFYNDLSPIFSLCLHRYSCSFYFSFTLSYIFTTIFHAASVLHLACIRLMSLNQPLFISPHSHNSYTTKYHFIFIFFICCYFCFPAIRSGKILFFLSNDFLNTQRGWECIYVRL